MPLTDRQVKAVKPDTKGRKFADGAGLHLFVTPSGSKIWRFRYYFEGREKLISFGEYPDLSLAVARNKRDEARKLVRDGKDPGAERKTEKLRRQTEAENSFEAVAREFVEEWRHRWTPDHADYFIRRLEMNIFPKLGSRPIAQINAPELMTELRKIKDRGALEMADRVRGICGQVFRYGIQIGKCASNPAADLAGAFAPPPQKELPAVPLDHAPELFRKLDQAHEPQYRCNALTVLGLRLLPLVMLRPSELRHGTWDEIDFDAAIWIKPIGTMKDKERPHEIPLSRQALAVLLDLQKLTGAGSLIFPGEGKKGVMSENTLNHALHRLGYKGRHCSHGFRAVASTTLNEAHWNFDVIEMQLHHKETNASRRPYNRAKYRSSRQIMLQWLADYYDHLRTDGYIEPGEFQKDVIIRAD